MEIHISTDPGELLVLPFLIVIGLALIASVSVGGNGGDVSWIIDVVDVLAVPAILLGMMLTGGAILANAA